MERERKAADGGVAGRRTLMDSLARAREFGRNVWKVDSLVVGAVDIADNAVTSGAAVKQFDAGTGLEQLNLAEPELLNIGAVVGVGALETADGVAGGTFDDFTRNQKTAWRLINDVDAKVDVAGLSADHAPGLTSHEFDAEGTFTAALLAMIHLLFFSAQLDNARPFRDDENERRGVAAGDDGDDDGIRQQEAGRAGDAGTGHEIHFSFE